MCPFRDQDFDHWTWNDLKVLVPFCTDHLFVSRSVSNVAGVLLLFLGPFRVSEWEGCGGFGKSTWSKINTHPQVVSIFVTTLIPNMSRFSHLLLCLFLKFNVCNNCAILASFLCNVNIIQPPPPSLPSWVFWTVPKYSWPVIWIYTNEWFILYLGTLQ